MSLAFGLERQEQGEKSGADKNEGTQAGVRDRIQKELKGKIKGRKKLKRHVIEKCKESETADGASRGEKV